ncbi:uncharacterized protein [Primulina huaijiensis]|uniref:uncharacterized protein isoform X2 n=1 Tax=Primulina huaijiensis TaxID=1492673 RepID=UPI003CC78267
MDNSGGSGLSTISRTARKQRSNLNRRPESESRQECHSVSLSSTPSDQTRGTLIEVNTKDLNSDQYNSRLSYANLANAEIVLKSGDEDGEVNESGQPGSAYDGTGNQRKFKLVRLKVGGVTHTIHARESLDGSCISGTSNMKSSHSEAVYSSRKLNPRENSDICFMGEKVGLCGVPWKDFSKIAFSFEKMDSSGLDMTGESVKQGSKHERSCERKFVNKKYVSDELYNDEDEDEDDEILYLQKLKNSKISVCSNTDYEDKTIGKQMRKVSRVMGWHTYGYETVIGQYDSSNLRKESMNSQLPRSFEVPDYLEDKDSVFDCEIEQLKNKNKRQEPIEVSKYSDMESSITTRKRAVLTGRDVSPGLGAGPTHFPTLSPATSRKQKEQLSEAEQQMKRAEAAKRRRMQNEKAARESEAVAIRKILGQDSSRKKREVKIKKQQENRAQERTSNSAKIASNVIRWIMGPSGTIVTFPVEIGLPSIFEPKPCSYPPP